MVGLTELIWRLRKNLIGVRQATDRSLLWHRLFADSALQFRSASFSCFFMFGCFKLLT